jgi:hypothetical protein
MVLTVTVELPLIVDELRAPTVPVDVAEVWPKSMLQSFFSFRAGTGGIFGMLA